MNDPDPRTVIQQLVSQGHHQAGYLRSPDLDQVILPDPGHHRVPGHFLVIRGNHENPGFRIPDHQRGFRDHQGVCHLFQHNGDPNEHPGFEIQGRVGNLHFHPGLSGLRLEYRRNSGQLPLERPVRKCIRGKDCPLADVEPAIIFSVTKKTAISGSSSTMETSGVLADTVSPSVTNFSAMKRVSLPPVQSANTDVYPSLIRAVSSWAWAFNTRAWAVSTRALAASHAARAASTWEAEDTPCFQGFHAAQFPLCNVPSVFRTGEVGVCYCKVRFCLGHGLDIFVIIQTGHFLFRRTGSPMSTAMYSTRPLTLGATRNSALDAREPLKVRRSSMGPWAMGAVSTGAAQIFPP